MRRGTLAHVDLTASDPGRSIPFYDAVLGRLGYTRGPPEPDNTAAAGWGIYDGNGSIFSIALEPARGPNAGRAHDRYSAGLHHIAFHAESRQDIDEFHDFLLEIGATILDPPAEYPEYEPGYYAVFFADPDGLKLELVHTPRP